MPSDTQVGGPADANSPVFPQNGQVDWVEFGKSIWSSSSVTLQRFAAADVQPITFGAGLALASAFTLDRVGKERMHSAIEKLGGFWSFEKLLFFGFGARSFLHVMADAQCGVNCIALCAALGEVHNEHAAAWILDDLWKIYGYPAQFLPSHSQLTALIKACTGVLTKTEFARLSDRMLGHAVNIRPVDVSNLEDIAMALRGLFRISKGEIAKITVFGGISCAFLAAFAHWILNLKVHVEDEGGMTIYRDSNVGEAQVLVIYGRQAESQLVQISSTTYILRDEDEMLMRNRTIQESMLTIRTPWDGCLNRMFGTTFQALTKAPINFGGFLGSVARVYQALALGEDDVGPFKRKSYINFVEPSYGIGFINSVINIFPELQRVSGLFDEMQLALKVSLREALRVIEHTILDLEKLCSCKTCTRPIPDTEVHCEVSVAFSIREMVSTLSCVTRDDDMLPTIRGIHFVYLRQHEHWCLRSSDEGRPLLATAVDLETKSTFGRDNDLIRYHDRLAHAIEIFSGFSDLEVYMPHAAPATGRSVRTAAVNHGICYYLDCLRSMSCHAEDARTVHVLPGRIQMGDRQFSHVSDIPRNEGSIEELTPVQFDILDGSEAFDIPRHPETPKFKLEMLGVEKAIDEELLVYYRATTSGGSVIQLQPGQVSRAILHGTGVLTCNRSHCNPRLVLPCALVRQGWLIPMECDLMEWVNSSKGPKCLIWPHVNDLARCVLIQLHKGSYVFLRKDECISCCLANLVHVDDRTALFHLIQA
ncbi:MAG: hypothetical protein L6R41_002060 [Letrouitia leprolyta]|nr:MAG: hypothetical protein L6R41_002060 [Letrouitia leprolyta]